NEELDKLGKNPGDAKAAQAALEKFDKLAQEAAGARQKIDGSAHGLEQAAQALQRAQANLKRASEPAHGEGFQQTLVHQLVGDIVETSQQITAALIQLPEVRQIAAETIAAARETAPQLTSKHNLAALT